MKKDIAEKWVAALRSGKYHQTQGYLCDGEGFCCLGVLCEISGLPYDKDTGTHLPANVLDWAGMEDEAGHFKCGSGSLIMLNDDDGYDFAHIASIIDRRWEEL